MICHVHSQERQSHCNHSFIVILLSLLRVPRIVRPINTRSRLPRLFVDNTLQGPLCFSIWERGQIKVICGIFDQPDNEKSDGQYQEVGRESGESSRY